jgi:hypothetical protein
MAERTKQTHILRIGGYSNEQIAARDLPDFRDAGVFTARSAIFPNPRSFGMGVMIKRAEVKESDVKNPLNSHCIEIEVEFDAPNEKAIQTWLSQTNNRLRAFSPVTLARDGGVRAPKGG